MEIAMITGPSSGIGLATALEMGSRGYHVVAAGRSPELTLAAVEQIEAAGGSAEYLHLELSSFESCVQTAKEFEASSRNIDVIILNAGVGTIRGLTKDGFEIHFGVNHLGHFMLTHHLRPTFRPGTRIVLPTSVADMGTTEVDLVELRRSYLRRVARRVGHRPVSDHEVSFLAADLNTDAAFVEEEWGAMALSRA